MIGTQPEEEKGETIQAEVIMELTLSDNERQFIYRMNAS